MEERCLCTCLFTRTEKNLKNQMDFITQYCNAKGVILDERISDIGSGLNYRRPKWNRLLQDVEDKRIAKILSRIKTASLVLVLTGLKISVKDTELRS